jgi:hypothetical protein
MQLEKIFTDRDFKRISFFLGVLDPVLKSSKLPASDPHHLIEVA